MADFRIQFLSGVSWTAGANIMGFIINFSLGVWLARILGPEAYGVIGMILVFVGFARLFMDFGFGEALVQKQETTDTDYSTVFWFNLIVSAILSMTLFFLASLISSFYNSSSLAPISRFLSLVFILQSFGMVHRVKLEKELKFKEIGISEVSSSLLATMIAIIFALSNYGVWSLVVFHLTKPLFYSVSMWFFTLWLPRFNFSLDSLRELIKFGFALFINGFFETIASSLDRLLVGKYFGSANLGLYEKAKSNVRLPAMQIMSAMGRVFFPLLSQIQEDTNRIYFIYTRIAGALTSILLPVMVFFFFFGEEIILFVYGDKWISMINLFTVMAITAGLIPFNVLIDSVVKSQGKARFINYITFYEKPIMITSVLFGIWFYDIKALTISVTIAIAVVFFIKTAIVAKCLNKSFIKLLHEHLKSLRLGLIPVLLIGLSNYFATTHIILIQFILFLIGFSVSYFIFRESSIKPVIKVLRGY